MTTTPWGFDLEQTFQLYRDLRAAKQATDRMRAHRHQQDMEIGGCAFPHCPNLKPEVPSKRGSLSAYRFSTRRFCDRHDAMLRHR